MSERIRKVQELAREVLGGAILELKDPRIGFATITAVRITPDLQQARVYVSVMGSSEEQAETMAGLNSARTHLRARLGREVRMKYLPELTFELDEGAERAQRIEEILHRIHEAEPEEEAE